MIHFPVPEAEVSCRRERDNVEREPATAIPSEQAAASESKYVYLTKIEIGA
jgi:hypothetical protein